jgi:hypothetical protein
VHKYTPEGGASRYAYKWKLKNAIGQPDMFLAYTVSAFISLMRYMSLMQCSPVLCGTSTTGGWRNANGPCSRVVHAMVGTEAQNALRMRRYAINAWAQDANSHDDALR